MDIWDPHFGFVLSPRLVGSRGNEWIFFVAIGVFAILTQSPGEDSSGLLYSSSIAAQAAYGRFAKACKTRINTKMMDFWSEKGECLVFYVSSF
jgi:hypothetical protein